MRELKTLHNCVQTGHWKCESGA